MRKLNLVAVVTLAALTGGCIFVSTTETAAPAFHERVYAGIPAGAMLLMYGGAGEISNMPRPELAPGLVYVYDEDRRQLVAVVPISKTSPLDVTPYIKAKPDHRYRIYYAPSAIAPTTIPAVDGKSV